MNDKIWTQVEAVKFAVVVASFKRESFRWKWMYWSGTVLLLCFSFCMGFWLRHHKWWYAAAEGVVMRKKIAPFGI